MVGDAGSDREKAGSRVDPKTGGSGSERRPPLRRHHQELAVSKHEGVAATQTIRIFFAFDPRRKAVLLIGGDKAGNAKRFYRQMVAKADRIYAAHLARIEKGAPEDGR